MATIHQKIAELLVQQADQTQSPLKGLLEDKDPQQVCHLIFASYRGNSELAKGMRLSDEGLQLMKAFFKSYEVKLIGGYKITAPHLIYLDRVNRMPYWLNNEYATFFDSELAMMLKLVDGSIQGLIESRFRLTSSENYLNPDF